MTDEQKILRDKLKGAVNNYVILTLKGLGPIRGRLNDYGGSSAITRKPYVIFDNGITQTFDVDKIADVEIVEDRYKDKFNT